ncbi:MAG: hypothetical protein CL921_00165 [Deltaproteobacteria bacterium]|nr:hypothetical protein [Deltaproteobacteria bacterium]|tara:strand:- start:17906 stop:18709 length:804 start_codon:yes stop_codon:yes gene_type:complete
MTRLTVAQVKDLSNQGGMSFSNGTITANGTLNVTNIVINGNVSGSSGYIVPSQSGQSGSFLSTNGSQIQWVGNSTNKGIPNGISVYNGNSTWNKPSGVKRIWVKCTGGGGGGSGYGESGAAGAHTESFVDVTNINSISVTVGGAGSGTGYSGRAGNGGTSSFGNYCSSGGGQGANRRQQHDGATGGNPNQGSVRIYGGSSQGHRNPPGLGHGGCSFWGGAAPTSHRQQQWAQRHRAHAAYGAGGSSGRNNERGGDGRQGIVVVYEFI